jgi:NitT/TauT family transport system substrate-binding protein
MGFCQMGRLTLPIFLLAAIATGSPLRAQMPVKVTLGFSFQGALSPFTLAHASGCYKRRGLDVTIDAGSGSGDALAKVAAGAYDIAIADFTSMLAFDGQHPDQSLIGTFIMIERAPTSIVTLRSSGISKPQDLVGKRIGDNVGETSREMFPAFAKANGIDPNSVTWINVSANLRHTSLLRGDYDAAAGHLYAITSGLRAIGVKDGEITTLPYAEWGVDQFGNAVVVRPAWGRAHPEALKAFVACSAEGIKGSIAEPKGAIASLKPFNSLLDETQALLELNFSNKFSIVTPDVAKHGLSFVDPARLEKVLTQVSDALGIARAAPDLAWTAAYLPPQEDLMVPAP